MTWSAIGSPVVANNIHGASDTFNATPTTLGNILVLVGGTAVGNPSGYQVSGFGVTTWDIVPLPGTGIGVLAIAFGVITSTGTQSGTVTGFGGIDATIQEFNPPSGLVSIDVYADSSYTAVSSGVIASVSPTSTNELYVGGVVNGIATASFSGSGGGFTYVANLLSMMIYETNVATPSSYSPAWADANGPSNYTTQGVCLMTPAPGTNSSQMIL